MSGKYLEQYDRMTRWYEKFSAIDKGREHNLPSDNYLDDVHAFFQNCYHLKDWIINDAAASRTTVEAHINSSRPLMLCADICNSLKHLSLTSPRSGENPAFGRKQFGVGIGGGPTTIKLKWQVDTTSGPLDAFQLATDCVAAWDAFLTAEGLK
jgi:hypothetical protein